MSKITELASSRLNHSNTFLIILSQPDDMTCKRCGTTKIDFDEMGEPPLDWRSGRAWCDVSTCLAAPRSPLAIA
jgi:hypothetical protein